MKKSLVAGAFAFQIIGLVLAEEAKTPPPKADIKVESTVVHKKEPVKAQQASEVKKTEKVVEAPKPSAPKSEPVVVNKMKMKNTKPKPEHCPKQRSNWMLKLQPLPLLLQLLSKKRLIMQRKSLL